MEKEKVKTRHEMAEETADKFQFDAAKRYRGVSEDYRDGFVAGWEAADANIMDHMYEEMEQLKKKLAIAEEREQKLVRVCRHLELSMYAIGKGMFKRPQGDLGDHGWPDYISMEIGQLMEKAIIAFRSALSEYKKSK